MSVDRRLDIAFFCSNNACRRVVGGLARKGEDSLRQTGKMWSFFLEKLRFLTVIFAFLTEK